MVRRTHRVVAALGAAAVVLTATACGSDDDSGSDGRLSVVASTDVWGSVVRTVGGDSVDVTAIIDDPSADPHSYEATPAQVAKMSDADVVVFNGGHYDEFVEDVINDGIDGATIEAFEISTHHDEGAEPEQDHSHGDVNEHVWYDLPTVKSVAHEVAKTLGELDPDNAETYTTNAASLGERLDAIAREVDTIKAAHTGTKVAVTEPVAQYLITAAGLDDVTPEEFVEAVEEESDPPAAAVAEARSLVSGRQVAVLVFNPQTETPVTASLRDDATGAGVPVVEMTETLPAGTDYVTWMEAQVRALGDALR